jgi:anti-anti-sigma factor
MAELFDVRVRVGEGVAVVEVSGDVGPFAQSRIRAAVADLLGDPGAAEVVLDVSRVTFIDQHGLAEMEYVRRMTQSRGLTFTLVTGRVVDEAMSGRTTDRRTTSPPTDGIRMACRVCRRGLVLDPARVAIVDGRVVYRCEYCENDFLMRAGDADALAGPAD